jgi:prolyl-tRNA synthetase
VHLVLIKDKDGIVEEAAERLYTQLKHAGLEPLFDDRDERAGVKFNDADLIGIPLRVTISKRSLKNGGFEFKLRDQNERWIVSEQETVQQIKEQLLKLNQELQTRFALS